MHSIAFQPLLTLQVKYVALLAFNKIVTSHPQLVAQHQDVILACIEDPDISIRLQALQLGSGMITSDNLHTVVDLLIKQLHEARRPEDEDMDRTRLKSIEPAASSDNSDSEDVSQQKTQRSRAAQSLPTEYRAAMIRQILEMCSRDTYTNITDFEWYVDTLVSLASLLPSQSGDVSSSNAIAAAVGVELRTVAVRVVSARSYTVRAAHILLLNRETLFAIPGSGISSLEVLEYAAWIVGEYSRTLNDPLHTLDSLLLLPKDTLRPQLICAYLQAIPKVLASEFVLEKNIWNDRVQAKTTLILARTVQFMQEFIDHASLEVQERAVSFFELMKLSQDAVTQHDRDASTSPAIISEVLPSLFTGQELNPVAPSAQRKVPLPENIDLTTPINDSLTELLLNAEKDALTEAEVNPTKLYYYQKPEPTAVTSRPAIESIPDVGMPSSYQNDASYASDSALQAVRRIERKERNREDPFYIPSNETSGRNTPLHGTFNGTNSQDLEIDSIPIMELNTGDLSSSKLAIQSSSTKSKRSIQIMAEETLDDPTNIHQSRNQDSRDNSASRPIRKGLLQVDSSNIGSLSLAQDDEGLADLPMSGDIDMARALADIERMRMEMQRDSERVNAPADMEISSTIVKKKKKKKKIPEGGKDETGEMNVDEPEAVVKKKKKKKKKTEDATTTIGS